MSTAIVDRRFTLTVYRCSSCGRYWADERAQLVNTCSCCVRKQKGEYIDILRKENDAQTLSIRALRGVITKLRWRK